MAFAGSEWLVFHHNSIASLVMSTFPSQFPWKPWKFSSDSTRNLHHRLPESNVVSKWWNALYCEFNNDNFTPSTSPSTAETISEYLAHIRQKYLKTLATDNLDLWEALAPSQLDLDDRFILEDKFGGLYFVVQRSFPHHAFRFWNFVGLDLRRGVFQQLLALYSTPDATISPLMKSHQIQLLESIRRYLIENKSTLFGAGEVDLNSVEFADRKRLADLGLDHRVIPFLLQWNRVITMNNTNQEGHQKSTLGILERIRVRLGSLESLYKISTLDLLSEAGGSELFKESLGWSLIALFSRR